MKHVENGLIFPAFSFFRITVNTMSRSPPEVIGYAIHPDDLSGDKGESRELLLSRASLIMTGVQGSFRPEQFRRNRFIASG
jgi:hypothetical protein